VRFRVRAREVGRIDPSQVCLVVAPVVKPPCCGVCLRVGEKRSQFVQRLGVGYVPASAAVANFVQHGDPVTEPRTAFAIGKPRSNVLAAAQFDVCFAGEDQGQVRGVAEQDLRSLQDSLICLGRRAGADGGFHAAPAVGDRVGEPGPHGVALVVEQGGGVAT
jgi:hypothetical protein